jgi:hypothetical protein
MEMDELKLILNTKFMRGMVTKIIKKAILKKTGYQVDIDLNEITVEVVDGKAHLHVNADVAINTNDLLDIVKSNDLI